MTETKHPAWACHLDSIADELLRLSVTCDVRLRDTGVIDRILKNDDTVCGTRNPIGFRKLRSLVMATFSSLNKAIDRIGPKETELITDAIAERVDRARAGGRAAPPAPGRGTSKKSGGDA
jgi:hypothetical protein